jgi:F-type H+-transporting ATPase subunit b
MQEILDQVVELLLGSIPTVILFIILVMAYQILVQGPLSKTLALRRGKTSGAIEAANRAVAAAEAKTQDYADKLRSARAEVFKAREHRLQQWAAERETVVTEARKKAEQRVADAKVLLLNEAQTARTTLLASADQLAEQVVRAVMPATAGGSR